ncbi:MAG: polymorphic toxin-type HINT domain-containing protein, partial [bacterium]
MVSGGGVDIEVRRHDACDAVCQAAIDAALRQQAIEHAKKVKATSVKDIIIQAGGELLLGVLGIDNILGCIGGKISACVWALIDAIPVAKIFSLAMKAKRIARLAEKAVRAIMKWRDDVKHANKILDGCRIPNSFIPGTLVLMADGSTKPIENLNLGDQVTATDPETGTTEHKTVTATITGTGIKHLVDFTVDLETAPGETGETGTLTATDGHPFWVPDLTEWIDAADLQPGQWLQTSAGTWTQISAINHRTQTTTVHNLTIADIHTYYVLAGNTPVLVHNCNGISGWTQHGADQAAARGISKDMAENAVKTGRRTPGNRPGTTKYTGRDVWVVLNDECEVVSCG